MNRIGALLFECAGSAGGGDLDFAVRSRRVGTATTITVFHLDGVMSFTYTDDELKTDDARRARQAAARRRKRCNGHDRGRT